MPDSLFRAAFDAASVAMGICSLDGHFVHANRAMERLFGYEAEELDGANLWQLALPDGSPNRLEDGAAGELDPVEKRFRRRDSSEFQGRLTLLRLAGAEGSLRSGQRHANETSTLVLALVEDVSQSRQLQEALRQSEKMEVIGRLAAGIAHDFNNLLTGIFLYSDLLLAELPPGSPHRRFVEELQLASEQGSALTRQLMAVLRKQGCEPRRIAVDNVIAAMERLIRHMIGERIELLIVPGAAAGYIVAGDGEFRQIVLNLALNARDALDCGKEAGAKIRLSTRMPNDRAIELAVEDNGCGMTAGIQARLFEPLFTTKRPGEGTGLGLATVKRIVSEWGGKIAVASAPGCGTRIEVSLPAAQGPDADRQASTGSSLSVVHS